MTLLPTENCIRELIFLSFCDETTCGKFAGTSCDAMCDIKNGKRYPKNKNQDNGVYELKKLTQTE